MKKFLLIVMVLVISGCAKPGAPIATLTAVKPTDRTVKGIDIYAKKRAKGEKVPTYRGDQMLTVRTYRENTETDLGFGPEMTGVKCKLIGAGYSATVVTPAKVRVPIYGYESTEIGVKCNRKGYKKSIVSVRSINKSSRDRLSAGAGGGLIGVIFMAVVDAASDEKKDVFIYPPVQVTMIKKKGGGRSARAR